MRRQPALTFLFGMMVLPVSGYEQPTCPDPALSDRQVQDILKKERATRTDLPPPFPQQRVSVRRLGCYYVYIEYGLPETPDQNHIFKLNGRGVIVDFQPGSPKCPEKVLTDSELAEIVKNERAKRSDLPPPFPMSRTHVERARCLYRYFEYAVPESRGNYQVFTIDAFGELMEVLRPDPY